MVGKVSDTNQISPIEIKSLLINLKTWYVLLSCTRKVGRQEFKNTPLGGDIGENGIT
jgi:hypothetical protein